eukprot:3031716-Pyramimonas_sp.AAC.1
MYPTSSHLKLKSCDYRVGGHAAVCGPLAPTHADDAVALHRHHVVASDILRVGAGGVRGQGSDARPHRQHVLVPHLRAYSRVRAQSKEGSEHIP